MNDQLTFLSFVILSFSVQNSLDEVTKYGYDRFTIETFQEELVELLDFIASPETTIISNRNSNNNNNSNISNSNNNNETKSQSLHTKLNEENSTSDYCTWYLRVLTSSYIKKDADRFIHYLDDPNYFDVHTFCSREVDPMGKECGMVQVLALAEAMGVKVKIEYLDGRDMIVVANKDDEGRDNNNDNDERDDGTIKKSKKKLMLHEFGPSTENGSNNEDCLEITLLYRPGHYDILYIL